ncbi:MAG: 4-vinyl reductase [Chloroflexota bacterium]
MAQIVLEPSGLYYPNRFARLLLLAMQDVMGLHGLNTILGMAGLNAYMDDLPPDDLARQFDFAYLAAINQALEDVYGIRGGRGIALRIGRAMIDKGLNRFGALAGMGDPAFRILPVDQRAWLGLQALAAVFNRFSDQLTNTTDDEAYYTFIVEPSPMTWGRSLDQQANHMLTGIIQGTLRWSTNGYEYHVQEMPPDVIDSEQTVFRINKKPIGGVSLG